MNTVPHYLLVIAMTATACSDSGLDGQTQKVMDSAGGDILHPEGLELLLPQNALTRPTTITLEVADGPRFILAPQRLRLENRAEVIIPAPGNADEVHVAQEREDGGLRVLEADYDETRETFTVSVSQLLPLRFVPRESDSPCEEGGIRYNIGDTFATTSRCNTCECTERGKRCTRQSCVSCQHEGLSYSFNVTFRSADGRKVCRCNPDGEVTCEDVSNGEAVCEHQGYFYHEGEKIPSGEGCLDCDCVRGDVVCADVACETPNPCVAGGCSGQLCKSADTAGLSSTCEWTEAYGCYAQYGLCGPYGDGQACGWLETQELQRCLAEARSDDA